MLDMKSVHTASLQIELDSSLYQYNLIAGYFSLPGLLKTLLVLDINHCCKWRQNICNTDLHSISASWDKTKEYLLAVSCHVQESRKPSKSIETDDPNIITYSLSP